MIRVFKLVIAFERYTSISLPKWRKHLFTAKKCVIIGVSIILISFAICTSVLINLPYERKNGTNYGACWNNPKYRFISNVSFLTLFHTIKRKYALNPLRLTNDSLS